jgi:hypothetical protein
MEIEEKFLKFRKETASQSLEKSKINKPYNRTLARILDSFVYRFSNTAELTKEIQEEKQAHRQFYDDDVHKTQLLKKDKNIKQRRTEKPELIEENGEEELEEDKLKMLKIVLKILLWCCLFVIFVKLEFGVVYLVTSLLVLIYLNTNIRKRKGVSAYSVFNKDLKRLPGQLTAEQLEQSLIRGF